MFLLIQLGFSVKWDKVSGPSCRIQFLGIVVDSFQQRLELPKDKLKALSSLAVFHTLRAKITKKQLQVLIGHMSFAF